MLMEAGAITKVMSQVEDNDLWVCQAALQAITEFSKHGVWFILYYSYMC